MEQVVLVNEQDEQIGTAEKLAAHQQNLLHRAFSIFIHNGKGEVLLQKRAPSKYHSGGLWTNTCCSHPRPKEEIIAAGKRRLQEEMGFSTDLEALFYFVYQADLDNNLSEHELDHVLVGEFHGVVTPNPLEATKVKWMSLADLITDISANPNDYTIWLQLIISQYSSKLIQAIQP
uniref:isopentenyl-diphosphate Delta-isomerase n=1 Tax=Fluviicola sp. TaxID=1917219 RepID=UPI004049C3A3